WCLTGRGPPPAPGNCSSSSRHCTGSAWSTVPTASRASQIQVQPGAAELLPGLVVQCLDMRRTVKRSCAISRREIAPLRGQSFTLGLLARRDVGDADGDILPGRIQTE